MDSPGQRLLAALVDVAFFCLVGFLAKLRILTEQAILPILLLYARERFSVAQNKQVMAMVAGGGPSQRPPPDGGGGGPGASSPTVAAQVPPTPPRDPGTFVGPVGPARRVWTALRRAWRTPWAWAALGALALLTACVPAALAQHVSGAYAAHHVSK